MAGAQLARLLHVPYVFTGHSLGRVKRQRLSLARALLTDPDGHLPTDPDEQLLTNPDGQPSSAASVKPDAGRRQAQRLQYGGNF